MLNDAGFALGSTVQSKTKGIWIWVRDHPLDPDCYLVLLDTEGLGDVEKVLILYYANNRQFRVYLYCIHIQYHINSSISTMNINRSPVKDRQWLMTSSICIRSSQLGSFWDWMLAAPKPVSTPVCSRQCPNFYSFSSNPIYDSVSSIYFNFFQLYFSFFYAVYVSAGFNKRLK